MRISQVILFVLCFIFATQFAHAQTNSAALIDVRISVVDANGAKVGGAVVSVYDTQDDYNNDSNPLISGTTSSRRGRVEFVGSIIKQRTNPYYFRVTLNGQNQSCSVNSFTVTSTLVEVSTAIQ